MGEAGIVTNTMGSQLPIGREPVGTDSVTGRTHQERCSAELHDDGVGGLEADAPDVAGQPIGVLAHNLDSIGTIGLENPYRSRRAYRGCAEIP
jgi:hypothetical protein